MEVVIIILIIAIFIPLMILQRNRYDRLIKEQIGRIGGTYVTHSREWGGLFSAGPFKLVGKGQTVYRIDTTVNNEAREGWVKFGSLFGPDWRL